jgi:dolichyl-diphosphooligosaccharide--protein glycosyltransferase
MLTAAVVYWILNTFNISVQIRNVCVLLAPWFASNTTVATYLLTKEVAGTTAGLVAAGLIAIVPGIPSARPLSVCL